ncbi:serine/threonine protein kinase [Picosynechococcus sp. PCC 11901]|uniref:bifunctional serine/threonine-protein kinase/formylglycine-generating enzyme family protein n=1 Tax=Picosynechococcus sp. PCC 11901 TaxID=2579791 RepID=UPI0010FBD957|nr:bifunctional serine/threonine-protein kinase/formylglycine-generating enzyme family protein [Picosynechococcus sp. PCC 11901]QCS49466.1 serine/threonine protein kinase [Picosynechococcus sp. PCC 11901]
MTYHQSQCLAPDCQTINPYDHKFCQRCGKRLTLRNRYRSVQFLGEGGFGRAFLAIDSDTWDTPCVIKQFLPNLGGASGSAVLEKAKELFKRESKQLKELGKHPQIPDLLAFFEEESKLYIVQEYIEGKNLLDLVLSQGRFPEAKIREFLASLLKVLEFVHEQKVIHRDIKPENIIYQTEKQQYVLIDFGVSKQVGSILTQVGTSAGTTGYAPPEQMRGYVDYSSDLYALAATTVRLLTGRFAQEVNGLIEDEVYDIPNCEWVFGDWCRRNRISLSKELEQILLKMLSLRPKERFAAATEVLSVLNTNKNQPQQITMPQVSSARNQPSMPSSFTEDLGNGVKLEMILIPAGSFMMGTPYDEITKLCKEYSSDGIRRESPQHRVTIPKPFYMGKFLVTQGQWQAVMGENPSYFKNGDNYPVDSVSWNDCQKFIKKLNKKTKKRYRLLSEAEWEYACRAGSSTKYCFGNEDRELRDYAWFGDNSGDQILDSLGIWQKHTEGSLYWDEINSNNCRSHPVGRKKPNQFGLYDMHGNLWEWCADAWHESYKDKPKEAKENDSITWSSSDKKLRVLRGGSWDFIPGGCRSATRLNDFPGSSYRYWGFRVACVGSSAPKICQNQ